MLESEQGESGADEWTAFSHWPCSTAVWPQGGDLLQRKQRAAQESGDSGVYKQVRAAHTDSQS